MMMSYLFLAAFIGGLLTGVRLMLFGAEQRRSDTTGLALRRAEPVVVSFLVVFGLVGYLITRHASMPVAMETAIAVLAGCTAAFLALRLAIAMTRMWPGAQLDDLQFQLQGRVGTVVDVIPPTGIGRVSFDDAGAMRVLDARSIASTAISVGEEICVDRVEGGMLFVEPWSVVELRL